MVMSDARTSRRLCCVGCCCCSGDADESVALSAYASAASLAKVAASRVDKVNGGNTKPTTSRVTRIPVLDGVIKDEAWW